MWVWDENGNLVGECWNCKHNQLIILQRHWHVEALCGECGEPQTIGISA